MDTFLIFIVFALDDQRYALALSSVERVIRAVEITPLPKAPEAVSGVINIQGNVVPVFDMRKRFRLPERHIKTTDQMVVAKTARRTVSFWVDRVEGVLERRMGEMVHHEEIHPELEYIDGVIKLEDGMVLIHNLERFLSLEEEKKLEKAIKPAREK